jgi:hypothetical protein
LFSTVFPQLVVLENRAHGHVLCYSAGSIPRLLYEISFLFLSDGCISLVRYIVSHISRPSLQLPPRQQQQQLLLPLQRQQLVDFFFLFLVSIIEQDNRRGCWLESIWFGVLKDAVLCELSTLIFAGFDLPPNFVSFDIPSLAILPGPRTRVCSISGGMFSLI